jgi:hypothetical protein
MRANDGPAGKSGNFRGIDGDMNVSKPSPYEIGHSAGARTNALEHWPAVDPRLSDPKPIDVSRTPVLGIGHGAFQDVFE